VIKNFYFYICVINFFLACPAPTPYDDIDKTTRNFSYSYFLESNLFILYFEKVEKLEQLKSWGMTSMRLRIIILILYTWRTLAL